MNSCRSSFCGLLLAVAVVEWTAHAFPGFASDPHSTRSLASNDVYHPFLINQVFNYYGNNGDGSCDHYRSDNEGFEYTKGTGKTLVYEDGVIWGGFHRGVPEPKIGGSTYNHGLQAGPIITYGTVTTDPVAADPSDPAYRLFRVRPDINPHVPFSLVQVRLDSGEVAFISRYERITAQDLYNQYVKDWNEWPAAEGAPFQYGVDLSGNPRHAPMPYDPNLDIPGVPGADQTLWYIANDMDAARVANFSVSLPIGVEMQKTIWGYNRAGALGSTIFISTLLINKSGAPVDSMYVGQWSDPDVGYAGDDLIGCDTTRHIGFAYNGPPIDAEYGSAVPAVGFVMLEGPMVPSPGDSAIFRWARRFGYKNIPMTSFSYSVPTNGPPDAYPPEYTYSYYNMLRGLNSNSGSSVIDPTTDKQTRFVFPGDPVSRTGWLDGTSSSPPGDRQMVMGSGPFTMAPGDTQEIVVANLAGVGKDHISSISVLLWYSDVALTVYKDLLVVPSPPPRPNVTFAALDREIVLSWGDTSSVSLESFNSLGYRFEGYNVYQFPRASTANPALVATYDKANGITIVFDNVYDPSSGYVIKKPVEFGGDFGISHSIDLRKDLINNTGLLNGSNYYLAVTAYSVNSAPGAAPVYLESPAQILKDALPYTTGIMPHSTNPGVRLGTFYSDTIMAVHTAGVADGGPLVTVIDPTRIPPGNFEIQIVVRDSVMSDGLVVPNPRWQLVDLGSGKVVIPPTLDFTTGRQNQMYLGMQVGLSAIPLYKYGKELSSVTWTGPSPCNFTAVPVFVVGVTNPGIFVGNEFFGEGILGPEEIRTDVEVEFVAPGQGQFAYDFVRDQTGSTGAPYTGFFPQPCNVWELNPDGSHKRRIDFVFMEKKGSAYCDSIWAPGASADDREYWFIIDEGYTSTAKAKYASATLGTALAADSILYSGWFTLTDPTKPAYVPGDKWTIKATKVVTTADRWDFGTASRAISYSGTDAVAEVSRINVFPNPYVRFSAQELNGNGSSVTFTHLPIRATIRILTLAGVLVRTITKNDDTQMSQWDLNNRSGHPVAAGVYIAYIDMPDLGLTKTLKLAVIP